jgi:hypothetical protein
MIDPTTGNDSPLTRRTSGFERWSWCATQGPRMAPIKSSPTDGTSECTYASESTNFPELRVLWQAAVRRPPRDRTCSSSMRTTTRGRCSRSPFRPLGSRRSRSMTGRTPSHAPNEGIQTSIVTEARTGHARSGVPLSDRATGRPSRPGTCPKRYRLFELSAGMMTDAGIVNHV